MPVRALAGFLSILLFLTSSPPLLAITMGQIKAGSAIPGAGGQGSFSNLQNAGAASAALTAAMAQGNLKKANDIIAAMKQVQADARKSVSASSVPNGLRPGGLEVYNPTGQVSAEGKVPVTWSGVSSLAETRSGASDASSATVNIMQSQQNAYLYWNKFNVGQQTTVNFNLADNLKANPGQNIAFNKVMSPSDPSHIFGTINAQGQVYILNQNGILFHNGSAVNTRSLVASTLPINSNLAGDPLKGINSQGLMNNPDAQFLFSALELFKNPNFSISKGFIPDAQPDQGIGNVFVEKGATITSPANENNSGGLVALIGPSVRNDGEIRTPNGQTIMAAGLQVGLKAHDSSDPSLRGLDVYVGKVTDPAINSRNIADGTIDGESSKGTVLNNGIISSFLGNTILAGRCVYQNGIIESGTSVSLNGRIDLIASYGTVVNTSFNPSVPSGALLQFQDTGLVDLGPGSVLSILPEWDSMEKVIGAELALKSIVSIIGGNVYLGADAMIVSPGASATENAISQIGLKLDHGVGIDAFAWQDDGTGNPFPLYSSGQIYLDHGAQIEASGSTDIAVDSSQNFLTLQLRGPELANSPLQRTSPIRGKDITVDIRNTGSFNGQYWAGTPLGDVTGYVNLIQRTVGQLTVAGGDVSMRAGDAVVISEKAGINVSGGWIRYSGGNFSTTKLVSSTGQIVDISNATPDQTYTEIVTSPARFYEAPYLSGGNGGHLNIQAPSMALQGDFHGTTVAGYRQLRPVLGGSGPSVMPSPSSFALSVLGETFDQKLKQKFYTSGFNPLIEISAGSSAIAALPGFLVNPDGVVADLPSQASFRGRIVLDSAIFGSSGFGSLTIDNRNGQFSIGRDVELSLGANGLLDVSASNIGIDGRIVSPGGSVLLNSEAVPYELQHGLAIFQQSNTRQKAILDVLDLEGGETVLQYGSVADDGSVLVLHADGTLSTTIYRLAANAKRSGRGSTTIGSQSRISTAGVMTVEPYGSVNLEPIMTSAGSITVHGVRTTLMPGSMLDVSGGVVVPIDSRALSYGNAGSIALSGGGDGEMPTIHNGDLFISGSVLKGYGFMSLGGVGSAAGSLSLSAPAIRIGDSLPDEPSGLITFDPAFFDKGGFSKFILAGTGVGVTGDPDCVTAVNISSGVALSPNVAARRIVFRNGAPESLVYVPTSNIGYAPSLTISALGLVDDKLPADSALLASGDLVFEQGSSVILEPKLTRSGGVPVASGGNLRLTGMTVEINGELVAPGGLIAVSGASDLIMNDIQAARRNPHVTVDLAPTALISTKGMALYTADPKGIRSRYGSVLAGGNVSISGNFVARDGSRIDASGATAIFDDYGISQAYRVDTSGGTITLGGGQVFYSDAILASNAGGATAAGGALVVSSSRFYRSGETKLPTDLSLELVQAGGVVPDFISSQGDISPIGSEIPFNGTGIRGGGHLSADSFSDGGFDSVTMSGNVAVSGPIEMSARRSISFATGGIVSANGKVTLDAPYVSLGRPFARPLAPSDAARTTVFGTLTDPFFAPPSYGSGELNVKASLIDLGNISLSGIGAANMDAGSGSIRGDGTFAMAGTLKLSAAQVYPVTGVDFTLVAFNYDAAGRAVPSGGTRGSITVQKTDNSAAPILSAGGGISIQASKISISGDIYAPFGRISIGSSSGAGNIKDPVSGLAAPDNSELAMETGSRISVSGASSSVLYGTSSDGTSWIDPSGTDISSMGLVPKSVALTGLGNEFSLAADSQIDLSGGGDLYALRWVSGLGGTINWLGTATSSWASDRSYSSGDLVLFGGSTWSARFGSRNKAPGISAYWTKLPESFAVLPGYDANYAPTGYADGSIGVGSRVWLQEGGGLSRGSYTLLPSIYATLPGAFLISIVNKERDAQNPISIAQQDGSAIVSGSLYNGLNTQGIPGDRVIFSVSSPDIVSGKVDYRKLDGDTFFSKAGSSSTKDAGKLEISSSSGLQINSRIVGGGYGEGRGSVIDLYAPARFAIGGGGAGDVILNPVTLNGWTYGSLLIGGLRGRADSSGVTPISVAAKSIAFGSGANLTGKDIILVSNDGIQFGENSGVTAQGTGIAPDEKISVTGNGALFRVSNDPEVSISRNLDVQGGGGSLSIAGNVSLQGASLILDSSGSLNIDPTASIKASKFVLNAGSVALVIDPAKMPSLSGPTLVIAGSTLEDLATAKSLDITSYSTMDFYGAGNFGSDAMISLGLHAGEIRGFDLGGGAVAISAQSILLDSTVSGETTGLVTMTPDGYLELNAHTISLGKNALTIDQFAYVSLNATGVIAGTAGGSLAVGTPAMPSSLFITTPLITATAGGSLAVAASGDLVIQAPDPGYATTPSLTAGAGTALNFTGATISVNSTLSAPSGRIKLYSTSGDVNVGGSGAALLDVSGVSKIFQSSLVAADAGIISLQSDEGNVNLASGASLNLSSSGSSSAGSLNITAPCGILTVDQNAALNASGGSSGGANGRFSLDVATLDPSGQGPSALSSIIPQLSPDANGNGGFTKSLSFRIRTGDVNVDTYVKTMCFNLSADQGSVVVTNDGVIDASGKTGGSIALQASGSVALMPNSALTVRGDTYDNAGKGGTVLLSAGSAVERAAADGCNSFDVNRDAILDLPTGSLIDLGVTAVATRPDQFGGTLHLRAPITADLLDIQIGSLDAAITGASSIAVEGYRVYDLTGTSGDITDTLRRSILDDASACFGPSGHNSETAGTILVRLTANQESPIARIVNLSPGVEIVNRSGDLTLNSDWDLSGFRTGDNQSPGYLTLRASGKVAFNASLSDGFDGAANTARLLALNTALPANFQSWSYLITAGSDMKATDPYMRDTAKEGSIHLGKPFPNGPNVATVPGFNALTSDSINGYYQVIRTGTGEISLNASRDISLWNQFASIYTAGVEVDDPTLEGRFDIPRPNFSNQEDFLGLAQQSVDDEGYALRSPQFSQAGGNVFLNASRDIAHKALGISGNEQIIVDDSVRQTPSNWLYRRGSLDSKTGLFDKVSIDGLLGGDVASTSWWVDFSNFFEGVGALGGGNIVMNAGRNISNVDASIPTNFRMPARDSGGLVKSGSIESTELGGGDLSIHSIGNIDGGIYYVERGVGSLRAGGSIVTNPTRDPQAPSVVYSQSKQSDPNSFMPTSLFLGKGSFEIEASGSILLGTAANVFMTPQGVNNGYWYKNYFSTYAPDSAVVIRSISGDVLIRAGAVSPRYTSVTPMLQLWMDQLSQPLEISNMSYYQPWIRLAESDVSDLGGMMGITAPNQRIAAISGNISLQGSLQIMPSSSGNVSMIAGGNISGLSPVGVNSEAQLWGSSLINISDANPEQIPGILNPLSQRSLLGDNKGKQNDNIQKSFFAATVSSVFGESGSYSGSYAVLETKQKLHATSLLHANDTQPVEMYALQGDLSGLTLFSPKKTLLYSGGNIRDVALYIQNNSPNDVSVVTARDSIIAYDPSSPLQTKARSDMRSSSADTLKKLLSSGDLQISGPGALLVRAGGDIDLGNGPNNADGTGVGITSIGNARNPALPFEGADIQLTAGVKSPQSLGTDKILAAAATSADSARYFKEVGEALKQSGDNGLSDAYSAIRSWNELIGSEQFTDDQKSRIALVLFDVVLREAGRDHNNPDSVGYGSYEAGEKAIATLFGQDYKGFGSVITWSRDIRTKNGGSITINAPGGGVTLANTAIGSTLTPPGIVTEYGGAINIFTRDNVDIGIGRIFTLRGGDIMIWSDKGNIAAGSSAKTVASAPPTRVLIDPQSGSVVTDLAGLATGGGIGVLATVKGAAVGNVDLIAPSGIIDAGDAGIRSSGNLNLAATKILNADNIAVAGISVGAPPASAPASAPPPAAPPAAAPPAAASTAAAANSSAAETASKNNASSQGDDTPSIYSIDILGYGGGDGDDEEKKAADATVAPVQASL